MMYYKDTSEYPSKLVSPNRPLSQPPFLNADAILPQKKRLRKKHTIHRTSRTAYFTFCILTPTALDQCGLPLLQIPH